MRIELRKWSRDSKAGGAGGGGAHFWGVDAETEMGEVGLAEGHTAGVKIAPNEQQKERNGGVVFVGDSVNNGRGEINSQKNFGVRNPTSLVTIFFRNEGILFALNFKFWRARKFRFFPNDGFEDSLRVSNGDADADGHHEGHVEKGAPPGFGPKLLLRDEIEAGNGASGGEEERQVDKEHLEPALIEADDHDGQKGNGEENHQGIADVCGEMEKGFCFDMPGRVGFENFGKDFLGGLHQDFGPARLLGFEAVHIHGKFGSALDVGEVEEFPAAKLCSVGKIGVLGERVVFPAACSFDSSTAPYPGSAIEVKERAAARARAVFDDEMAVEQNRFDLSKERIVAIEIGPPRLDHADVFAFGRIEEIGNRAAEKVGFRDEVRVEDSDEFALRSFETIFEGASFETFAIGAVNVSDGHALRSMAVDASFGDFASFVG